MSNKDEHYMRHALNIGRRGLGRAAPNPSVGCVIVKDDVVIATGRTADAGRPHAEAAALALADEHAKGATAYVTLEPCALPGREGPCSEALIKAQVARVVIACHDPNPAVFKKGESLLKEAGIDVSFGILEDEARQMHQGFFSKIEKNRPHVTLKLAISADKKIAAEVGQRTQISGELASRHMHLQRSRHDAILIGSETFLTDQPRLTTRMHGVSHDPLRVILDRRERIKHAHGFEVLRMDKIKDVLSNLAEKGITRLLVEGGVEIHKAFMAAGMADEFQLCKSQNILGDGGVEGLDGDDIQALSSLKLQKTRILGEDILEIYT